MSPAAIVATVRNLPETTDKPCTLTRATVTADHFLTWPNAYDCPRAVVEEAVHAGRVGL